MITREIWIVDTLLFYINVILKFNVSELFLKFSSVLESNIYVFGSDAEGNF